MHLLVANQAYSSWSFRPWLLMRYFELDFDMTVVPLYQPDSKPRILQISPTGKVPCLTDGDAKIWESLAILDYLADTHPDLPIWPADRVARAFARSVAAEMHAGFSDLRAAYTCNFRRQYPAWKVRGEAAIADGARIQAIWTEGRARFGAGGPFLCGAFSAADAMYAPIVSRFETYRWPVDPVSRAYMDAVIALPAYQEWLAAGRAEPWVVDHYEYED